MLYSLNAGWHPPNLVPLSTATWYLRLLSEIRNTHMPCVYYYTGSPILRVLPNVLP